jgi:ribonuclease D
VCWSPPADGDVAAALRALGARDWQVQLVAPLLGEVTRIGT